MTRARLSVWIAAGLLTLLVATSVPSSRVTEAAVINDSDEINTVEILATTLAGAPDCLNYCVTGVCSFLQCKCNLSGCGCQVKVGPKVKHFNPDLVVSSYTIGTTATGAKKRNNPWTEINALIGPLENSAGDTTIAALLAGLVSGAGTGQRTSTPGQHVQLIQKEVDALGHPMASLMGMIGGSFSIGTYTGGGTAFSNDVGAPAATAGDWSADFGGAEATTSTQNYAAATATVGGTAKDVSTYSDYAALAASWASIVNPIFMSLATTAVQLGQIADAVQTAADAVAAVKALSSFKGITLGVGINFFCPSAAKSFFPYYVSALDTVAWRFAIPERLYPEAFLPPIPGAPYTREVGQPPYGFGSGFTWGNVYPRAGFLGSSDDRTAGAVFAQRAADFITRPGQPHVYLPLGTPNGGKWRTYAAREADAAHTKWQMLSPVKSTTCEAFGMEQYWPYKNVGDALASPALGLSSQKIKYNSTASYAYTLWRNYECCAAVGGSYLGSIDIPETCLPLPPLPGI